MTLLLLLSLLLTAHTQASTPAIKFISGPEVVAELGKTTSLVCKVENGNDYPIIWMKKIGENISPLSTGKNLILDDPRFNLSYESVNDEAIISIQIDKIEEQDDAVYLCQVKVGINDMITRKVTLHVKTPVKILDGSTTQSTVVEGQKASLDCLTSGYPAPVVEWSRTDGQIMSSGNLKSTGNSLLIESVHRTDRGQFQCVATNSVGPAQNMTSDLIVRYGPEISVPRPRIRQAPGYEVLLQCLVDSFPTPAIDWKRDGEIVESDNHFYIAHFNKGPTSTLTTLRVYGLTEADYGSYQCNARNAHGNDTQTVELQKTQIPIPEAAYGGSLVHHCSLLSLLSSLSLLLISVLVI